MGGLVLRSCAGACLWVVLVCAAPGYRLVEPVPRVRLEVPAGWQEHRRAEDVVYTPPGVDYRAKGLAYGVRVFVERGGATTAARRLDGLLASYARANPGLRADGPYLIDVAQARASVDFSHAPPDDPTVREGGWIVVARLAGGRWLAVMAVMPDGEKERRADVLAHVRASLRVL